MKVPALSYQADTFATVAVVRDAYVTFSTVQLALHLINPNPSVITVVLSRFILELARLGSRASDVEQGDHGPKGVLTTEWTGYVSDIPSQWTLNEYNGARVRQRRRWRVPRSEFRPGRLGHRDLRA